MRLIDGDALMKRLGIAYDCSECDQDKPPYCTWKPDVVDVCQIISDAPTIEPERKWISCSERLPESIKPVIITWCNNDPKSYYQYIVGKPFIGTGHYCKGKWFWYSSTCEDLLAEYGRSDVDEVDEAIEVIAWMPLPEPYQEEGDQDDK